MKQKAPTVSVIIPVHNEEDRIFDCLKAVTSQTVRPRQILVIDNNSSDQTFSIAKRFKGVTVVYETKQGLTLARNKGFSMATGDILARIDADTIISSTWIEQVQQLFQLDSNLDGVSGYGRTRVGVTIPLFSDIWSWAYFAHTKAFFGTTILWGANMAIRKSAWQKVENLYCLDDVMLHEDQDISLALNSVGSSLKIVPDLNVSVDFGDIQYIDKFWAYNKKKHYTRQAHRAHYRSRLTTNKYIPYYQRLTLHACSTYTVGFFMIFTLINSARRASIIAIKQSSLYFWYQKIKSDLEGIGF